MTISAKKSAPTSQLDERQQTLFNYYFYQAQLTYHLQQYDESIALYQYCINLNPNDPQCYYSLGLIYQAMQADKYAQPYLEKALQLQPYNWQYREALANFEYAQHNRDKAIEIIKEETKLHPENNVAYEMLATLYTQTNQPKLAVKALKAVERNNGITTTSNTYSIYKIYINNNQHKEAIKTLQSYLKQNPDDYEMKCLLANTLTQTGQTEKAEEIYQELSQQHSDNKFVYLSLIDFYTIKKQEQRAKDLVINAIYSPQLDLDSKLEVLHYNTDLLKRHNIDIEPLIVEIIQQYPQEEQPHQYYASFLEANNRKDDLINTLLTITDINPDNEKTWQKLLDLATEKKDDSLIVQITDKALILQPNEPIYYLYKSFQHTQDSNYVSAIEICQKALQLEFPDNKLHLKLAILKHIGDLYNLLGNFEETTKAYDQALALYPEDIYTLNNYAYAIATNNGDLNKAEKMSAKTVKAEPTNPTYLDTYAWILYLKGDITLAKYYIEKALEYDKDDNLEIILHHTIINR